MVVMSIVDQIKDKREQKKDEEIIAQCYLDGNSIAKVHEIFPYYSADYIYKIIRRKKIVRSVADSHKKYTFNNHYFDDIDTEEKAYWLGFIYADGYIINGIKGKINDTFGITLSEKDIGHIKKFKKCVESNHKIHTYKNSYNTYSSYIKITDQHFVDTLISKGVLRNKSLILRFPTEDIVPKKLIFHFMRGYFDGDGSFKKNGTNAYDMSILGTKEFLTEFKTVLNVDNKIKKARKNSNVNNYELTFGGMIKVKHFSKKLYENANIYLDRKYERYLKIQNYETDKYKNNIYN